MSTLQEFLKKRAELAREAKPHKQEIQAEWRGALERLINQIVAWLTDSDKEKILEVREEWHFRREEGVGSYSVLGLVVALEAREVQIVPIARNAVGPLASTGTIRVGRSYGRVDMTNGAEKYTLYRTQVEPSDQWVIVHEDEFVPRPFDRNSFDAAMQSLLQ
jgi:hypothetical protein